MHAASATRITAACAIGVVLVCIPILIVLSQSPDDTPSVAAAAHTQAGAPPAPAPQSAAPTTLGEDASTVPQPKHARLRHFGQTGSDDGIEFTLDPPTIHKSVSFHRYSATPDAHGRFVFMDLRIVNHSGSKVVDPCPDWHLFDTRDRVYTPYSRFPELKTNKSLCATLPKGGTQVGTLVFDVDPGSRPLAVEMWSDDQGDFDGENDLVRFVP
jgi:hypothetical protein